MNMPIPSNGANLSIKPRRLRAQLRDIIDATGCTEARAREIEISINDQGLLDWSECEMAELYRVARRVDKALNEGSYIMYKVTQAKKGYVSSVSYQKAGGAEEAIEIAKIYHGYSGEWRAEPV